MAVEGEEAEVAEEDEVVPGHPAGVVVAAAHSSEEGREVGRELVVHNRVLPGQEVVVEHVPLEDVEAGVQGEVARVQQDEAGAGVGLLFVVILTAT